MVFDLFHTLIDPEVFRPPGFTRAGFTAEFFGFDPLKTEYAWNAEISRAVVDGSRTVTTFARDLLASEGRPLTDVDDHNLARYDRTMGVYQDRALREPIPSAIRTLRRLRAAGLRLGLLSNAIERDCREWTSSPLGPLFDAVCLSYEIGVSKPLPAAYLAMLRALGAPAAACAYVGDGGQDELAGARRAGFGLVIYAAERCPVPAAHAERRLARSAQAHVTALRLEDVPDLVLNRW